jgi:hypothetical protein
MKARILLFFLVVLSGVGAACSKDPASGNSGSTPPAAPVQLTALGSDGLPVGWTDAPFSRQQLYFESEKPGPCPPCPGDAKCSPCPPPFYRFSTKPGDAPDGRMVFVEFTTPPRALNTGSVYRLSGRTVAWVPHGDVFVCMDKDPKEWFPPEKCQRLFDEYLAGRAAAPGTCATDDQCTILPGGVDDCGRVIDQKTAALLEDTYRTFRELCGLKLRCAPRAARPACRDGRCVEIQGK